MSGGTQDSVIPQAFADEMLRAHAAVGEPYRLTTRQLLRRPPTFDPSIVGETVFVCENPPVVEAAANRLGALGAPLVCIEGQPKTAARLLLERLVSSGIRLMYHGDFDWAGVRIANLIMSRHEAAPWRFSTTDYHLGVKNGGTVLKGDPVDAQWDPQLRSTMSDEGRAVHEEQLLDRLFEDLRADRGGA